MLEPRPRNFQSGSVRCRGAQQHAAYLLFFIDPASTPGDWQSSVRTAPLRAGLKPVAFVHGPWLLLTLAFEADRRLGS